MPVPKLPDVVDSQRLAGALSAAPEIRLLDVRTPAEFDRTRIPGSYNIPLGELAAHAKALTAIKAPVVLVCRSGARARTADAMLRQAGMRRVHVLEGGVLAWRAAGLQVEGQPLTAGAVVRRLMGVAGLVIAFLSLRQNPLMALVLAVLGLRLAMGQSVMPCAATGTCAVPVDRGAVARALVEGLPTAGTPPSRGPGLIAPAPGEA